MNIFKALVMREVLDGKNGYLYVPVILAAITLFFMLVSGLGFGQVDIIHEMEREGVSNLGEAIALAQEKEGAEVNAAVAIGYFATTALVWIGLPFVILVRLISCLYDERRDRSILFWKSMPTADWQEVLAKLFVPLIVAPVIFLAVVMVTQLVIAVILTITVLVQGGPALVMMPLGGMVSLWFGWISMYFVYILWAMPILAWMLLVSAYANRMPFLWAILPPAVLIATEASFFETARVGRWILIQLGGWMGGAFRHYGDQDHIDSPRDVLGALIGGPQLDALAYSLSSLQFWAGIVIAGMFVYAAIEMRKRAI